MKRVWFMKWDAIHTGLINDDYKEGSLPVFVKNVALAKSDGTSFNSAPILETISNPLYFSYRKALTAYKKHSKDKKEQYRKECSTIEGLLRFPLTYDIKSIDMDSEAAEVYKEMVEKYLKEHKGE